jgi:hypothetical protein
MVSSHGLNSTLASFQASFLSEFLERTNQASRGSAHRADRLGGAGRRPGVLNPPQCRGYTTCAWFVQEELGTWAEQTGTLLKGLRKNPAPASGDGDILGFE